MSIQNINLNMSIAWIRLKNSDNKPYKWGDRKDSTTDPNWAKSNVIYRWVKNSTGETAEIGDINRFKSSKALANYSGLIPSVRASGDSVRVGGITKLGSRPLRHALVEASINVIRKSRALNRLFNRVLYRGNVQKARVAVARKLAVIIYAMLKHREPFRAQIA